MSNLPTVHREHMSHDYISVNNISDKIDYNGGRLELLKEIIRGIDATSSRRMTGFSKEFGIPISGRKKVEKRDELVKELISSQRDRKKLIRMRKFLLGKSDPSSQFIDQYNRDYDGLLGKVFHHDHFEEMREHIINDYDKPENKDIALFTGCASVKPYPYSPTYSKLFSKMDQALRDKVHWLVLSNSTAPIPEEFHGIFPFYAYETDVRSFNKSDRAEYVDIMKHYLADYLTEKNYDMFLAYIRPRSIQNSLLKEVENEIDIEIRRVPSEGTIREIKDLGKGYWGFRGLRHKYALEELFSHLQA